MWFMALALHFQFAQAFDATQFKSLMDSNRYPEALVLLDKSPEDTGVFHYNKGVVLFRLGQTGLALAHFEKAHVLMPSDADTRHNLLITRTKLKADTGLRDLEPASHWLQNMTSNLDLDDVRNILGICALLLVFAWIRGLRLRSSLRYAIFRPVSLILTIALLLSGSVFWIAKYGAPSHLAVSTEPVTIRSGPGESYAELIKFPAGIKIQIVGQSDAKWLQVRYQSDAIGWLPVGTVLLL